MHFNVLNRRIHYWGSFIVAIPVLIIISSGILLQMKKQWDWVQPPEIRGTGKVPVIGFDEIMATLQATPLLGVDGWDDVARIDVRADRGLAKVTIRSGWEAQIDLGTGRLLQTAYRRSDLIETIHDGSFFAGDWTKLGLFLPAGVTLLALWLTGMWMWWVPFRAKWRRKTATPRNVAAAALLAAGLPIVGHAQATLAVDPRIGHWETTVEAGESVILADARKWKTDEATTPFPIAAVRGVDNFTEGVLSTKFKLVAGASDQIAGLVFGLTPKNEYFYARYNTKDGNIALWQFVDGDRKRLVEGAEHIQLALGIWHDLRVEVRGSTVRASVNGKLHLEHKLTTPVSGRVGFYTKRDSVTAFKAFSLSK
ncbi:MAG: PepSY domain-containing protein [Chloroflexota bacterium]|nr:PepSY domain-containing protein [Chloroflexota bacterium]